MSTSSPGFKVRPMARAQGIAERGHVLTEGDAVRVLGAQESGENCRALPPCADRLPWRAQKLPWVLTLQVA